MKIKFILLLFSFIYLFFGCETAEDKNSYTEIESESTIETEGYKGDESCKLCHKNEFNTWRDSHHDLAMQKVDQESVLGDFNDVRVSIDGVAYFFFKNETGYYVNSKEIDGAEKEYKIAYVFGLTPLQQYLVDFPNGRKQVLRVTWDSIANKWFHQYAGDQIKTNDWLHWTNGAQNWNTMCAECHSTNLKKNYFVEKDSFATTYSSINVSCESCHGPGARHIKWANSERSDKNMYVIMGNDQTTQLNMCAPCHARRVKLTRDMTPGLSFEDQYLVQNISAEYYHEDGQILEEDYVYGSFLQSEMHSQGIKCGDCHNVHSLELKLTGNDLCLQCHVPDKYNTEEHHFHQMSTEASQCINCHMTGRYYMGNDFRRDHSFRVPRPDQSVDFGTPNACNDCHTDKSEKWAADWVVNWYGNERKPHFSNYLLLSNKDVLKSSERGELDLFINDLNYPAIARSTVIGNLNLSNEAQFESILLALTDSSAIVRYNALMRFRGMNAQDRMSVARKHITDTTKLVRIGCAQLLINFDGSGWDESEKLALFKAKEELEIMLFGNADFSTGRLQLGDYFLQSDDIRSAIKHYEIALKKDSLLFPVYTNLATAYSLNNEMDKALETLNTWIDLNADAGRPYYLRALLNFELGNNDIAVEDLNMAIELNPIDTRSMYNLSTYYYQHKQFDQAIIHVRQALEIEPENSEIKYLYALILKEQGKIQEANKIMKEIQGT